jgi:predicted AAA+ superfamily ATPase
MTSLYQKFEFLIEHTDAGFKRYLFDEIAWSSRMVGIIGPRGVGKTTLVLQYIKTQLDTKRALYAAADDLYFSQHRLYDVADEFYKHGGEVLFIDEIHKYPEWSRELKNIYDAFPTLKVVFTGSSVLDILKGTADLSRRALMYKLQGLSFREYMRLYHGRDVEVHDLNSIVNHDVKWPRELRPLPLFADYLRRGYYPFGVEGELHHRLGQIVVQTLETDIPQFANLNVGTARKLKQLLTIIAESVPFKPNFSKIAAILGVSRNSLDDYFAYMEQAGLIAQLRGGALGIRGLGKVDKVYLDNPNLVYNLQATQPNVGNLRETFFYNQMRLRHVVEAADRADFTLDGYTFEVGGKHKKQIQIDQNSTSFIVKDDIEFGHRNIIPLWAFGLTY